MAKPEKHILHILHILIVDDDAALQESLSEQLQLNSEFSTAPVASASAALAYSASRAVDVMLIAAQLPDMPGVELCRLLRGQGVGCPIILLGTVDHWAQSGASGALAKPLRFSVLRDRIRSLLRAPRDIQEENHAIGPHLFGPVARQLTHALTGVVVRLTEKEAAMLLYLVRAGGVVVAREELLQNVWGYHAAATTHTLETHIYRLRQKLEDNPAEAHILVTEPGGYRLVR